MLSHHDDYIVECLVLLKHRYLYYQCDENIISDYEYDRRHQALIDYEEKYPEMKVNFSPTDMVGFAYKGLSYNHEVTEL
jgi:NAD-dependent DNA ligase